MAKAPDPTKDPAFQKVIKAFLTTPPKRHENEKVGKANAKRGKSPKARRRPSSSRISEDG